MTVKELMPFVEAAAENWEAESEYAGRMELWCHYCGNYQGEDRRANDHKDNCLHVKALEILGGGKDDG